MLRLKKPRGFEYRILPHHVEVDLGYGQIPRVIPTPPGGGGGGNKLQKQTEVCMQTSNLIHKSQSCRGGSRGEVLGPTKHSAPPSLYRMHEAVFY